MDKREWLAEDILRGCPEDLVEDHLQIAHAIKSGVPLDVLLDMEELNRWPETHFYVKSQLEHEIIDS